MDLNIPFRAEHVGSLLRSQAILDMWYNDSREMEEKADDLKSLEDIEIKKAVETQQSLGFRAITDGEIRRQIHWGTFFTDLDGFEEVTVKDLSVFRPYVGVTKLFTEAGEEGARVVVCTGKIKHVRSSFLKDFLYLKSLVSPAAVKDIKMTVSSLELLHLIYKQGHAYPTSVYSSDEEYFADLTAAFRQEITILYDAGMRNLQIDDPNLTYFCDYEMHKGWANDQANIRTSSEQIDLYVKVINDSIKGLPSDLRISLHLCKGNFKSGYWASGSYDLIATQLFRTCRVNTYFLEFDSDRSGGFEPLRELPMDKGVVLGLITSKKGDLEDKKALKTRVFQAAQQLADGSGESTASAMRRIGVSPQCGFASANIGNQITRGQMVAKLKLVRELANDLWPGEP